MLELEIKNIIEEFIKKTSFSFEKIDISFNQDSGSYWVSIESNDSKNLIGKDGETIQSINHLVKRVLETKNKDQNSPKIIIDINNYQKSKIEKIKTLAYMMAERARFFKSKVELDPMNPFERRLVHEFISKQEDLESESFGFGKNRRVVIKYKEKNNTPSL